MRETWKSIPGYPSYEASNLGRIRSVERSIEIINHGTKCFRLHKSFIRKTNFFNGYERLSLHNINRVRDIELVHRLVAFAWIPNPEGKPFINHKNGIRSDNRVKNLEWCTSLENTKHAIENGLKKMPKDHCGTVLTDEQVLCIRSLSGHIPQREMGWFFGVSQNHISRIIRKKYRI